MSPAMDDPRHPYIPGHPRAKVSGAQLPAPKMAPAVFHGRGAFVAEFANFPPDYGLELLNGFDWLAIKTAHGLADVPVTDEGARWIRDYRAAGLLLVSWSWITADDAEQQGRLHAELANRIGAGGHIANGEKLLALTGADGYPDPVAFARSREWIRGFREVRGPMPLAICPEPREDLDHKAWQQAGAAYMPQAYAENGFNVTAAAAYAQDQGWRLSQIVPLIEPRGAGREVDLAAEVVSCGGLGFPGLGLYPADGLLDRPDIYQAFVA